MKPLCHVFEEIVGLKNLLSAANATLSEGRRFRGEGALFKFNLERELLRLHDELMTGRYRHGCYRLFTILDPKQRIVAAATVKDRVVHHAVHDVIEPRLDGMFIHDSYACRRGKGTHAALDRAHGFLRLSRYGLHLDVKSYFQSIDHEILKALLRRYVADERARILIERIVDSTNDPERKGSRRASVTVNPSVAAQLEFNLRPGNGDNRVGRARGLPLGNLTSQFFANLYLNELDQYVKHELKVRRYVRYMDDMLMFADEKASLLEWEKAVRDFARRELFLELRPAGGPRPVGRGIGFLGFRLFPGYRRLKKTSVTRFIRRMNAYSRDYVALWPDRARRAALRSEIQQSTQSFHAHALNGNTYRIRKRLYDRFPTINQYALAGMKERWRGFGKGSR
ncbi:MAG: group II intron reverse transcriptase domain-containing protein [Elusimicrobia bacterium]|nr:group II intron reverse transcriptase domain-containing protein [Elusimicrobiota bacterium]